MADFVMTLSDDDESPSAKIDEDVSDAESGVQPSRKKRKTKGTSSDLRSADLNPGFYFDAEGSLQSSRNKTSWDFSQAKAAIQKKSTFRTSVDEKILRKKRASNPAVSLDDETSMPSGGKANGDAAGTNAEDTKIDDEHADSYESDQESVVEDDNDVPEMLHGEPGSDDESSEVDDGDQSDGVEEETSGDDDEEEASDSGDIVNDKRKRDFFDTPPPPEPDGPTIDAFTQLKLSRPIMRSVAGLGWTKPTPVQVRTIPLALQGKDICGSAVTGSGKTAAFMIPILERLLYRPNQAPQTRVLVLVPTRELGAQVHSVATNLAKFCDVRISLCVGGLSRAAQEAELRTRPDIIVATTGRLIDHVRNSAGVGLDGLEILVIDEADRILDEGFEDELNEIMSLTPRSRQTMLFSATMTDDIDSLVRLHMTKPVRLFVDPTTSITTNLVQEFVRIRAHKEEDRSAVLAALCSRTYKTRCIVFFRSKKGAHRMKVVFGFLGLKAAELHGDLTQIQRLEALEEFRDERVDFLMATDLAARGLDIAGIETVINYDMPKNYSQYVHRVGRTARGSTAGKAISLVGEQDRSILKLALKNSRAGVKHRVIPPDVISKYKTTIAAIDKDVESVLQEEKEEALLAQADMEATKAENLIKHKDEIYAKPARTWFQSEKEKASAKETSADLSDSRKRKRDEYEAGKPKRSKYDGLSRDKKRRMKIREEEKQSLVHEKAAAHHAKSSFKPKKLPRLASHEGEKPKGSSAKGASRSLSKKKPGKLLGAGFKSEIRGARGGSAGARKVGKGNSKSNSNGKRKFTRR